MDFYQGVVVDYLRADRAMFVNTQCCIQLNESQNPDTSGPHWYCDAVAVDFRDEAVFLCEISYAQRLGSLLERLKEWAQNWDGICESLARDCKLPTGWEVRPWLFVPAHSIQLLEQRLSQMTKADGSPAFNARITPLESVQPWMYRSWNHRDRGTPKPEVSEPFRA
jgi:hypothetical protein